ncbi:DUF4158 domain-containing protein [Streptomyces sp. NBC_00053]|nr:MULTISPECIES: DUF4158 domain-containing protein [unclassified Streptomyces]WSG52320.1 DUF4158 domain-containing protein [Streptomyces sp. NBC_01732]WSX02953.1 DUF4158 domain-containing protein [Streptomyces sp. NBC_00987]MCX4395102.1 DUF4158 domain-containing protein [Streptomyces sp. NBC_01767]MCX5102241.1 DUF4158 domain-containing protein [Streptomyces sp. NBC_00439]MCX5502056.1 DUF4158 domain-containing protein [Streptomyces sp. NBC_00052]
MARRGPPARGWPLVWQQHGHYGSLLPACAELERFFFLDDADREKVQAKRRAHNRLGFAVQLTTVRFLGRFMPDPRQVPHEVAEYLAEQLGIEDASVLAEYGERDGTAHSHAGEIQQDGGWRDFAEVRDELVVWLDARAWTTGEGLVVEELLQHRIDTATHVPQVQGVRGQPHDVHAPPASPWPVTG